MTVGKISGKRYRGNRKEKSLDRLLSWHRKLSAQELIRAVGDSKISRGMIARASQQGTR